MIQVYKCDFCQKTDKDSEVIIEHEKQCSFNKNLKVCWTCVHHVDEGMPISGSMYICQKGLDCWDIVVERKPCEKWEDEDLTKL